MKKIALSVLIAISLCSTTAFSHSPNNDSTATKNPSASSQSASQPRAHKKPNLINKWLFQKEPAHYSESYERGVYRVRDRK